MAPSTSSMQPVLSASGVHRRRDLSPLFRVDAGGLVRQAQFLAGSPVTAWLGRNSGENVRSTGMDSVVL
eukprot:1092686-Prymnesium_polylepis.1